MTIATKYAILIAIFKTVIAITATLKPKAPDDASATDLADSDIKVINSLVIR